MKTKEVKIEHPVIVGGKTYDMLTLGTFRTKHFKYLPDEFFAYEKEDFDKLTKVEKTKLSIKMIPLIAAMANVDQEVIDELEFDDTLKVMEAFSDFLGLLFLSTDGKK